MSSEPMIMSNPAPVDAEYALRRARQVSTRPTTIIAVEFCSSKNDIRERVRKLTQQFTDWDKSFSGQISEYSLAASLLSHDAPAAKRLALSSAVLANADSNLSDEFEAMFHKLLVSRVSKHNCDENDNDDTIDEDSHNDNNSNEHEFYHNLQRLGWLEGFLKDTLLNVVHRIIIREAKEKIAGDYETEGLFTTLLAWKESVIDPWLCDCVGEDHYESWKDKLENATAEAFCLVRIDELFEILANYPDSHAAVLELRSLLPYTSLAPTLGQALQSTLIRRTNHPGATTTQIINIYTTTIQVLRVLDPSDRLLSVVTEPIREYLRNRPDTVRCIVSSFTDESGDLYYELRRTDAKSLEYVALDSDRQDEDMADEEQPDMDNWQPLPSLYQPRGTFSQNMNEKSAETVDRSDILVMLISIYGSKELFVNEYRLMLADKLLANLDGQTDSEVHTLELLKLRFGESSMRNCEVMIKDMDDSKRTNANIHSNWPSKIDASILSHIFWPSLPKESFKHHPRLQNQLDRYSNAYSNLKNPRKLIWLHQLGTVKVELNVTDIVNNAPVSRLAVFDCSPFLATLISHFEDKSDWTAEDLSNETGVAVNIIEKRMTYWVSNRVLQMVQTRNNGTVYRLATPDSGRSDKVDKDEDMPYFDDDDDDVPGISLAGQEEEEMEVYLSYIVGMLTRLGQLPLKTIHNNLKTHVTGSDIQYNKTPQQLASFLQVLCRQERLECGPDGMYKLFKK